MLGAFFGDLERGRQGKDRLAMLDGGDPAGREASAIAQAFDLVEDGGLGVSGPEEVGMERMHPSPFHGSSGGHQRLPGDLSSENRIAFILGILAAKEVDLQFLEFEEGDQLVDIFLHGLTCLIGAERGAGAA